MKENAYQPPQDAERPRRRKWPWIVLLVILALALASPVLFSLMVDILRMQKVLP